MAIGAPHAGEPLVIAIWKQASLAISTEIASLSLLDSSNSTERLLGYFLLHAVSAALVTSLAWMLLPSRLRKPRWAVLSLLFTFDFFIPGLGVVAMLAVIHVALRFPSVVQHERFTEVSEPVFMSSEKEKRGQADIRAGHARRILRDPTQSVDTKLRVLIALQDMRPKVAIPLLQGLLADPAEDIRLLAYSMMDAWEKDLTQRIQKAQAQLDDAAQRTGQMQADAEQHTITINAHRRMAELYWEQVDTGLARGDLRVFALQKAKTHCEVALPLDAHMGGMWLLYSLVLIELNMGEAANRALRLARKAGLSDVQVLPHLARVAYDAGEYEEVAQWMRRAARAGHLPHPLRQVARYWAGKSLDVQIS